MPTQKDVSLACSDTRDRISTILGRPLSSMEIAIATVAFHDGAFWGATDVREDLDRYRETTSRILAQAAPETFEALRLKAVDLKEQLDAAKAENSVLYATNVTLIETNESLRRSVREQPNLSESATLLAPSTDGEAVSSPTDLEKP